VAARLAAQKAPEDVRPPRRALSSPNCSGTRPASAAATAGRRRGPEALQLVLVAPGALYEEDEDEEEEEEEVEDEAPQAFDKPRPRSAPLGSRPARRARAASTGTMRSTPSRSNSRSSSKSTKSTSSKGVATWEEFEALKARCAAAMDRGEYLFGARMRLAAEVAGQEQELRRMVLSGTPQVFESLAQGVPKVKRAVREQGDLMRSSGTAEKRMRSLSDLVVRQEARFAGNRNASAVARSASKSSPAATEALLVAAGGAQYPNYREILSGCPLGPAKAA